MLAPALLRNDIVVLNNLSTHKAADVAEAIAAQGAQLVFLPPYSPDQPDRAGVRKIQGGAASGRRAHPERLWPAIGQTLERYQPQECRNVFKAGCAI